jgi:phosphate transport system substrate-binding protein
VEYIELPVAYDGLTIVVNKENAFVDQLTVEDLQKIFLGESAAKSWKDINPAWDDLPIKIYSPGTDSGTFDYFKEVVAGKDGQMRSDMSTSEDDNQLVTGVAGEKGAIGFFGASYYFTNQDKLKAVPIVNPQDGKAVLPSPEAIESGEYAPFSRPLFIYVNLASVKKPEMKKFVEYYLKNAPEIAKKVQYVALPDDLYKRAQEHYENRLTGTHYIDGEGNPRSGALAKVYTKENLPLAKSE